MARIAPAQSLVPGTILSVDGEELVLEWRAGAARGVVRDQRRLISGGPREGFERRIARWLKREALEVLSRDTAAIAALAGVTVRAVAVGDAATRWGSCSASGRIRYNMRLLLLPPEVRRYVVAHEVAHRVHMDHGAAFHALEADLFGGPVGPARLALRRLGPGLKRIDLAS
jgi:predicted metal-dependent hydrolase